MNRNFEWPISSMTNLLAFTDSKIVEIIDYSSISDNQDWLLIWLYGQCLLEIQNPI